VKCFSDVNIIVCLLWFVSL